MIHRPSTPVTLAGIFAVLVQVVISPAYSCGVKWKKPATHFDGVDEFGNVSFWDQIGELKVGGGVALPVVIGFRSDWEYLSPYLGHGWRLGILDSCFIQRSEHEFDMIQPDGYTVPFGRDPKNPGILHGAKGWKAQMSGNLIEVYASCGWKLSFEKGRLSFLCTPGNRILEIRRDAGGVATDVVSGTEVLLKVRRDSQGAVNGLRVNEQWIELEQTEKPSVQCVAGANLVSGKETAMGRIVLPNGSTWKFEYGLTDRIQPTLSISKSESPASRLIAWDPATRTILSDGSWYYHITPAAHRGHNAAIARTQADGRKEFWHYDLDRAEERITDSLGKTTIKRWFGSSNLIGKPRSVESIAKNGARSVTRYSYDEKGNLLRKIGSEESFLREYSADRRTVATLSLDGTLVHEETYDEQLRLVERRHPVGKTENFSYSPVGTHKTITSPDGRKTEILISGGRIASYKTFEKSGQLIQELGRPLSQTP